VAYQALKPAIGRSTKTAAKRRSDVKPVEIGGMVMTFCDQFARESGRSRKLQQRWGGPFIVIEFDEPTQNLTVSMLWRIYRWERGVFHYSGVEAYHPNDNERLPGRAHIKLAPILIHNQKEWEVETILDDRTRHGRGQFMGNRKGTRIGRIFGSLSKVFKTERMGSRHGGLTICPGRNFLLSFLVILRYVLRQLLQSSPLRVILATGNRFSPHDHFFLAG